MAHGHPGTTGYTTGALEGVDRHIVRNAVTRIIPQDSQIYLASPILQSVRGGAFSFLRLRPTSNHVSYLKCSAQMTSNALQLNAVM